MWPEFISGRHHKIIAEKLQRVASGELKRLINNMAPRHTKSEFASFLFPAWMMGQNPNMKIIQATHTTELAVNFGRKTKNLIDSDDYKEIFPEVKLAADSKASGRWDWCYMLKPRNRCRRGLVSHAPTLKQMPQGNGVGAVLAA